MMIYFQAITMDLNKMRRALIGSELKYVPKSNYHTSDDLAYIVPVYLTMKL